MLSSATTAVPAPTFAGLPQWRYATLRWVAGLYFLILGASLLLLPQGSLGPWLGIMWLRGACSAASGLVLLWLAGTQPGRRVALTVSVLVVVPQLLFATEYLIRGTIPAGAILVLFSLGILLAALAPPVQTVAPQPDALGLVLGLGQTVQGFDLALRPEAGIVVPAGLGIPAPTVGYLFILGGSAVVLTQLWPSLPRLLRTTAHALSGVGVLGLWVALAVFQDPLYWVLGAAVVLRGVAIVILPWWSEAVARFDNRSLRVRLALALVTVALVPLLVALPLVLNEVESRSIENALVPPGASPPFPTLVAASELSRVRQVAFGIAVLGGLAAGAAGWWLASRLAAPMVHLMNAVGRIAEGQRDAMLPREGPTELVHLSAAVETMASALDAHSREMAGLVHQLKAQNQELRDLQEMREDNIRAISHDLRNPLTVVQVNAQLLERRLAQQGLTRDTEMARSIVQQAKHLTAMTQDLAEALRIEAGGVELKLEPLDAAAFVQEVVGRHGVPEQSRLRVVAPATPQRVLADRVHLERILGNLLSNALKYSPPDAPVVVRVEGQGETVTVAITDQGPGLSAEEQAGLFKRYARTQQSQGTAGLGLGLYITRALVEAHGGGVWVESEPGKGTTFGFSLPGVPA